MRRVAVFLAASMLLFAACGSSSKKSGYANVPAVSASNEKTRPQITVEAHEFAFTMPATTVPTGWVDITLRNIGKQAHQMFIVKLGSMSFTEFKRRAATSDLTKLPADTVFVGGPNNAGPGETVTATVHLDTGNYAIGCEIPDDKDGKAHAAHGMVAQFTAAPTPNSVETAPNADGGTIETSEFTFVTNTTFEGQGTVAMTNIGNQIHEVVIDKLAPGKTLDDMKKFFLSPPGTASSGPPPFTTAGGVVGIGPHQTNYQRLSLSPGHYVMVCFFPDVTDKAQLPHVLKGMIKEFTIS